MSEQIDLNSPFRINNRFIGGRSDGMFKDYTIYNLTPFHSGNRQVNIYFRPEGFFINPPTNKQESAIWGRIKRYGIVYVSEREFNDIRKEFGKELMKGLVFNHDKTDDSMPTLDNKDKPND